MAKTTGLVGQYPGKFEHMTWFTQLAMGLRMKA